MLFLFGALVYDSPSPKMFQIFLYSVILTLGDVPWHMTFQICCEVYVVDSLKTRFFQLTEILSVLVICVHLCFHNCLFVNLETPRSSSFPLSEKPVLSLLSLVATQLSRMNIPTSGLWFL